MMNGIPNIVSFIWLSFQKSTNHVSGEYEKLTPVSNPSNQPAKYPRFLDLIRILLCHDSHRIQEAGWS